MNSAGAKKLRPRFQQECKGILIQDNTLHAQRNTPLWNSNLLMSPSFVAPLKP